MKSLSDWKANIGDGVVYPESKVKEFIEKLKVRMCLNGSDYQENNSFCNDCLCCRDINEEAGKELGGSE